MKRVWFAVVIIGVIGGVCAFSTWWQQRALDKLETALSATEQLVENGDLKAALSSAKTFEQLCIESGEHFAFLEQHGDSFTLKETASLLPTLLEQGELPLFFTEAARCRYCIEELRRERTPALNNIF